MLSWGGGQMLSWGCWPCATKRTLHFRKWKAYIVAWRYKVNPLGFSWKAAWWKKIDSGLSTEPGIAAFAGQSLYLLSQLEGYWLAVWGQYNFYSTKGDMADIAGYTTFFFFWRNTKNFMQYIKAKQNESAFWTYIFNQIYFVKKI